MAEAQTHVPSGLADGMEPRPAAASRYGVFHARTHTSHSVAVSERAVDYDMPALAEAGKPFEVGYFRSAADLGHAGDLDQIRLHYRIDGGDIQTETLADGSRDLRNGELLRSRASIDVPATARGEIEYWFELCTKDGETLWDSEGGKNYRVDVVPEGGATVKFDDLWGEAISGPVKAGEALRIAYDADRIRQFLQGMHHHGLATYNIDAFVAFDGKPATPLPIAIVERGTHGESMDMKFFEPAVEVPKDAKQVSIWFKGGAYGGALVNGQWSDAAWDSDYGRNYVFDVEG